MDHVTGKGLPVAPGAPGSCDDESDEELLEDDELEELLESPLLLFVALTVAPPGICEVCSTLPPALPSWSANICPC
jgi:hypothetical protein